MKIVANCAISRSALSRLVSITALKGNFSPNKSNMRIFISSLLLCSALSFHLREESLDPTLLNVTSQAFKGAIDYFQGLALPQLYRDKAELIQKELDKCPGSVEDMNQFDAYILLDACKSADPMAASLFLLHLVISNMFLKSLPCTDLWTSINHKKEELLVAGIVRDYPVFIIPAVAIRLNLTSPILEQKPDFLSSLFHTALSTTLPDATVQALTTAAGDQVSDDDIQTIAKWGLWAASDDGQREIQVFERLLDEISTPALAICSVLTPFLEDLHLSLKV